MEKSAEEILTIKSEYNIEDLKDVEHTNFVAGIAP